jgi:hypothetical protein
VLYPGKRRGEVRADLHGELAAILALSQAGGSKNRTPEEGVRFSVVAGTCNRLNLQLRLLTSVAIAELTRRRPEKCPFQR